LLFSPVTARAAGASTLHKHNQLRGEKGRSELNYSAHTLLHEKEYWGHGLTAAKKAPYFRNDSTLTKFDCMGFELDGDAVKVDGCTENPVNLYGKIS
jgi:hypothetical protein